MVVLMHFHYEAELEEVRNELREIRNKQYRSDDEQKKLAEHLLQLLAEQGSKYDVLLKIIAKQEEVRGSNDKMVKVTTEKLFDIINDLIKYVSKMKEDDQATVASLHCKMDENQHDTLAYVTKTMQDNQGSVARLEDRADENQQRILMMNETLHLVVELFVQLRHEMDQYKNDSMALAEELKSRAPITIKNEITVEKDYHIQEVRDPYRNMGERYGAAVGAFVGGLTQDMVAGLWTRLIDLLAKMK